MSTWTWKCVWNLTSQRPWTWNCAYGMRTVCHVNRRIDCQCLKCALGEELGCDQLLMRKKLLGHIQKLKLEAKSDSNETWFFLAVNIYAVQNGWISWLQVSITLYISITGRTNHFMTSICSSCCWFPRAGSFFWRSAGVTGIWPRRVGISPRTWPCHCHRPIPPAHRSPRRWPRPSSRLCAMPRLALRRNHLHQRLQWKYNTIRPGSRNADAKNVVWCWDWHWNCKKLATVNIICTSLIFWHPALEDMTLAVLHTEWEQLNLLQEEFQNAAGIFEKLLEWFTLVGSDSFFVSMDSVRQFQAGSSSCLAHSTDSTDQDLYQLAETVVEQLAKFLSASDFFSLLSTHHTNEIEPLFNLWFMQKWYLWYPLVN